MIEVVGKPYVLWVTLGGALVLGAAYWFYLADIIASVHHMVKHLRTQAAGDTIDPENLKNLAQGSAVLLAALVAAATLIFTLIRVWIVERTTTATEEGLITDRINAAVASLGAEKTIKKDDKEQTVPNIEVRIGAILALERMAKKNADVHIQIMEILTAYIRENAPVTEGEHDRKPRQDIQLAFTVIGRRPTKRIALEPMQNFRLDFRNCDLTRSDGLGLNFANAQFTNARLMHAILRRANMQNTDLWNANLLNADLWNVKLQDATLENANLLNADLRDVNLQGADFRNVNMQNADLRDANLQDADFRDANMQGADLRDVNLQGAKNLTDALLRCASVRVFDFTDLPISQDQIDEMFGDGSVTLPDTITWPSHWPKEELSDDEFHTKWEEWKKTLPPDGD